MGDYWAGIDRSAFDHPLLTAREERELLSRAVTGDQQAIECLVKSNQRLVLKVALKYYYSGMAGDLSLAELLQQGNIALVETIRRFDLSKNVRLSTPLTWWLRAMIRRYAMTKGKPLARTVREADLEHRIRKSIARQHQLLQREPTNEEISADTGISAFLVGKIMPFIESSVLSIDGHGKYGDLPMEECLPSPTRDPADEVEEKLAQAELREALKELPPKWAQVIELRFFSDPQRSYTAVGRLLGVSKTRIQQIERLAIERLRGQIGRDAEAGTA